MKVLKGVSEESGWVPSNFFIVNLLIMGALVWELYIIHLTDSTPALYGILQWGLFCLLVNAIFHARKRMFPPTAPKREAT